jgi:hypothetical protein
VTRHFHRCVAPGLAALGLAMVPVHAAHADDPPADVAATVSADAKAVGTAVKRDAKVVAEAAKEGAKQVAVAAKEVAHEVAVTTKQGAEQVAAAAKRGAKKTKAAIKTDKTGKAEPKPADSSDNKPAQ